MKSMMMALMKVLFRGEAGEPSLPNDVGDQAGGADGEHGDERLVLVASISVGRKTEGKEELSKERSKKVSKEEK
jgi:hypothetical protein